MPSPNSLDRLSAAAKFADVLQFSEFDANSLPLRNAVARAYDVPLPTGFHLGVGVNNIYCNVFQLGPTWLILLGPARTAEIVNAIYDGWRNRASLPGIGVKHVYLYNQALALMNSLASANIRVATQIDIAGYSAGGMVGSYLAPMLKAANGSVVINLQTFGSPRGQQLSAAVSSEGICDKYNRWFLSDDPVCGFPTRSSRNSLVTFVVGAFFVRSWDSWADSRDAQELRTDGSWANVDEPSQAAPFTFGQLRSFYLGQNTDVQSLHAIQRYAIRLFYAVPARPRLLDRPVPHAPRVPLPDAQQIRRDLVHAQGAVFNRQASQNAVQVFIPRAARVHAIKWGAVWQVTFQKVVIATVVGKRHARGMARFLNAFLDSYQASAIADPAALQQAILVYLGAAADPASGIVPVLST